MWTVIYVEAIRLDESPERVRFRFVCQSCSIKGAAHPSLTEAEQWARRHRKVHHGEAVSA